MRIRLLAMLGGRPPGAVFEHDDAGAQALIDAGFAEPAEHETRPASQPASGAQAEPPATTAPKRIRTTRRG